ncbi:MAG TPA: POTRA domain-containing protein [Pyrinomonadaceae bacterium]|nr:POTRA domain-containing protein [Pyrinomonadaceae bacterium]
MQNLVIANTIARGLRFFSRLALQVFFVLHLSFVPWTIANASSSDVRIEDYEGRLISAIDLTFEGTAPDPSAQVELISLLKVAPNTEFSAVRVRDSLQALFDSGRVANARVEITEEGLTRGSPIKLRFVVQRQILIADVRVEVGAVTGSPISDDELRARLNLIHPGTRLSKQVILRNADEIQVYLRDRGYFEATVEPVEELDASGTRATVTYRINPGEQSTISAFNIDIPGFDPTLIKTTLSLQPGAPFTRDALASDVGRIRDAILAQGYLAPMLEDPRPQRDAEHNTITILLNGTKGPKVSVAVSGYELSAKTQRELLPVMREGNIDYSAIIEGARRIRNRLQEDGYFFAEVTPVCTVANPPADFGPNNSEETCQTLTPASLSDRTVGISYQVERGRRFRLTDIRITGTNKLTLADIENELKTQRASAIGLIPYLGYGRGYTSIALLEQDRRTVEGLMRDLGYRRATVAVLQGVSINGDNLIISFEVNEGPLTRVAGVEVRGNRIFTDQQLKDELHAVIGGPFSRTEARFDSDRLVSLYARQGYPNTRMEFSVIELPKKGEDEQVRLVYSITNESEKVFINRIIINGVTGSTGTQEKKRKAILRAIPLAEGDPLRADRISEAERELYLTDAYRQVIIRREQAGETTSGYRREDIIIDVEEKKPRVMDYGGGYSTDVGALGLFEISNVNLMNSLRQGAIRLRASKRQQLVRFEYLDPRWVRYRKNQFAPLGVTVEYNRDSTVTRFFRSAIDQGTSGIVQRLDEDGNPINEFGIPVDEPSINRFSVTLETQRVLDQKSRTIVFARYAYEDVRLFNLESLVVKPILQPDKAVRLSRIGGSLVRDTRERCERTFLGNRRIAEGETLGAPGEICRYNQTDATRGDFLSFDYALALRQLGGNISFNRFQAVYRRYYKVDQLRGTVFAANFNLGLANLFNPRDRDENGRIDEIDLTLPISERFFSGGATTLRGFRFEEAGPREVIIPEGPFRDDNGEVVFLNPFTVPTGGNALAVVNLEARIPLSKSFQIVPFYDGGNVFRRVGDLFGKKDPNPVPPTDVLAFIKQENLRAHWTNTFGLGLRIQTPLGGALAIDYGVLVSPPEFLIPQRGPTGGFDGVPAVFRLNRGRLHFRLSQTF